MKKLIIVGTVEEVTKIINNIIERYGGKTKVLEYLKKMEKDRVVLV